MRPGTDFFQVGGTLAEDAPSYVRRPADDELFEALRRGELCLVLAPRQTGKSSLMVQARKRLMQEGVRTAIVDLQRLGEERDPDRFFNSVMSQVRRTLGLKADAEEWAAAHQRLSPAERFAAFLQDVVLAEAEGEVVIFFDEIDSILKLPFSDDFFTTVRSLYNSRATEPALRRLTFAFVGTTTKTAFIKDRSRTPFNIGTEIALTDFEREDSAPFKRVLGDDSGPLVERIFHWTGGQPLLVQKLAAAAYSWPPAERTPARLDAEVERSYLKQKIEQDTHLKFIRDYLLDDPSLLRQTLATYAEVLDEKRVEENDRSPAQERLKLAGVVRAERGQLVPRNRIYTSIFSPQWVEEHAPPALDRVNKMAVAAAAVLGVFSLLIGFWPQLRPRLLPRFPASPTAPYSVASLPAEIRLPAEDAARAYLKVTGAGGEVETKSLAVADGNVVVPLTSLPRGESEHTLTVEGGWFTKSHDVSFKVVYYRDWLVRQFPDASLANIAPLIQISRGQIRLRDVSNGQVLGSLPGQGRDTTVAVWSPDRTRLLAGGRDGSVRLWAASLLGYGPDPPLLNATLLAVGKAGGGAVRSLAFAPGGNNNFVSGHDDGTVRVWTYLAPGTDAPKPDGIMLSRTVPDKFFAGPITAVAFEPKGYSLVALSPGDAPKYYSPTERRVVRAFGSGALCFALSRDGKTLATGGNDGAVKLWEMETGRELKTLPGGTQVEGVAFSEDGSYVLAAAGLNLKLWEVATGREVRSFDTRVSEPDAVGFSPDGLAVFARNEKSGQLQVWDFTTGREIQPFSGHTAGIEDVAVSPDGRKLATASSDSTVKLWNFDTGELLHTLSGHAGAAGSVTEEVGVWAAAFSPDGKVLVSGGADKTLQLWDVETGEQLDVINMPQQVPYIAFSANGKMIAVGNFESGVELIDFDTRRVVRQFKQAGASRGVAFSPDGRMLAAVSSGADATLWDVQTGEMIRSIALIIGSATPLSNYSVIFSPDGKTLALNSGVAMVVVNVETSQIVQTLTGHEGNIYSIAFSPDGSKLASASNDRTLRLWLVGGGSLLRTFSGHNGSVTGVAFSPDGKTVVSSSFDSTARLWWAVVDR